MRRKAFLFTFLVLSLLLAACVRSGGTEGENSYTIYYPAAELRDVPGEDAIVARTVQLPDADTLTQEELAQRLLERLLADAPDAGVRAPMPGGTTLLSLSVLGNWARVDFSRQYARLAGIDLTLADYCVTLTLTQLDGVNAVSITCGFVSGITERSLKRTRSTSVGFITLPSFAMAAAIIAFCNGVSTVSP